MLIKTAPPSRAIALSVNIARMTDEAIEKYLSERIAAGDFPSAVYLAAENGDVVFSGALGYAVVDPERIAATTDTIYDIASLTKPLVTGLLSAIAIERGNLKLTSTVGEFLTDAGDKSSITLLELMTHTSHLPSWRPFYLLVDRPADVVAEILRIPLELEQPPVTYSDLNFLLIAAIVEKALGLSLKQAAEAEIFDRLGLKRTMFSPPAQLRRVIAASEFGNEYEEQTASELMGRVSANPPASPERFRHYQIWGEVHDGNAFYLGGAAGHAGLFSTASDVALIAAQFLPDQSQLLTPLTCRLFAQNYTPELNEHRSLAFQLASTPASTAGSKLAPQSLGHLGFTGTSVWIDPTRSRVYVLLTNRTHHHPLPFANINAVRRRFHDLAAEALDANI